MIKNKPVNIFEDGLESRNFISVKDITKGVIRLQRYIEGTMEVSTKSILLLIFKLEISANNKADILKARRILNSKPP